MNNYFDNKTILSVRASTHTDLMHDNYKTYINNSINNTKIYDTNFSINNNNIKNNNPTTIVDNLDSISAIFKYSNNKTAVLNFASYKNPGGMFLKGSSAQEESLCHKSFLYNVLSNFDDSYYSWNRLHKNKSLYLNRALYSKDILFYNNSSIYCDVITCAAPNKTAAQKYCHVSDEENSKYLNERIKFVLDIANYNNVDTLILGAFGCGVFGQDPNEVAKIFKHYLTNNHYNFNIVIFAIPDKNSRNYKSFSMLFND